MRYPRRAPARRQRRTASARPSLPLPEVAETCVCDLENGCEVQTVLECQKRKQYPSKQQILGGVAGLEYRLGILLLCRRLCVVSRRKGFRHGARILLIMGTGQHCR